VNSIHFLLPRCLATLLVISSANAAPIPRAGATTATATADELVPLLSIRRIKIGMTAREVRRQSGEPDEAISPQLWIYWHFQETRAPTDMKNPAVLVVFKGDRVALLRLCEGETVQQMLPRMRAAAQRSLASK
jgi:hypothetical protein